MWTHKFNAMSNSRQRKFSLPVIQNKQSRKSFSETQVATVLILHCEHCFRANLSIYRNKKEVSTHLRCARWSFIQKLISKCYKLYKLKCYSCQARSNSISFRFPYSQSVLCCSSFMCSAFDCCSFSIPSIFFFTF